MRNPLPTLRPKDRLRRLQRGSVLIVAMMLSSAIGISLVSYIKVCANTQKLANRSFLANSANNLAEMGLEEAIWTFNEMGSGVSASSLWTANNGWTTDTTKLAVINVTNGGTNYTSNPTVTISGGGGSGAAATARVEGGKVRDVTITNRGSGFTSAPTISFSGGGGSGATATATNLSATRTLSTVALDGNATGVVKIFVAGYDGNYRTPIVVTKTTVTPADAEGGAPVTKIIMVKFQFNGPFVNGVVAKNGITWNGQPMADSWISSTTPGTGPWTNYSAAVARSNTTVADLTGTVSLGAQGDVRGNLTLGSGATYSGNGSVTGSISYDFSSDFSLPSFPTTSSVSTYYNLVSMPAVLPRVGDSPNASDGRYYYFVSAVPIANTAINTTLVTPPDGSGIAKVTIVGTGVNVSGTVTVATTGNLKIYTDGTINATYVNNSWAGALQIYTSTASGTTINGNDNVKACIFAPNSAITGNGGGNSGAFYGSFVGRTVTSNGHMDFHYDETLSSISSSKPWRLSTWRELRTSDERAIFDQQLVF